MATASAATLKFMGVRPKDGKEKEVGATFRTPKGGWWVMPYFKGYFEWRFIKQEGLEGTALGAKLRRLRWLITEIGQTNTDKIARNDPFHLRVLNRIIPLGWATYDGRRAYLGVIFHMQVTRWQIATKRHMWALLTDRNLKGAEVVVVLAFDWTQNRFFLGEIKKWGFKVKAVSWRTAREPLISVLLECAERCYDFLNGKLNLSLLDEDNLAWLRNTVLDAYLGVI